MKIIIAYAFALALVALVHGLETQATGAIGVHDSSSSKHLLRERSVEEGEFENIQVCTPNATKMEDCNRCFCTLDGSGWACTRMGCAHREVVVKDPESAVEV